MVTSPHGARRYNESPVGGTGQGFPRAARWRRRIPYAIIILVAYQVFSILLFRSKLESTEERNRLHPFTKEPEPIKLVATTSHPLRVASPAPPRAHHTLLPLPTVAHAGRRPTSPPPRISPPKPTEGPRHATLPDNACQPLSKLFGLLGGTLASILCSVGAAAGITRAGEAAAQVGIMDKKRMTRALLPVVMAELLSIYGLISGVVITLQVGNAGTGYTLPAGFLHLGAGLSIGGSSLLAGMCIGTVGGACNRAMITQPAVFTASVLLLVFSEAIALYGLIGGLLLSGRASGALTDIPCLPQG